MNARLAVVGELPMLPAEPILEPGRPSARQPTRVSWRLARRASLPIWTPCNQGMRSRARRSSSRQRPRSSSDTATASWSLRTDGSISTLG